jgi:predicted RNase H-like HicB family nuclease
MIRTDDLHAHQDEPAKVELKVELLAGHPSQPGRPGLPNQLIGKYVDRAMIRAEAKQYPDGTWFAEIPGFPGVWANQPSEEAALEELRDTLHEWVLLKIQDRDRDLPVVDSINLNVL